MPRLVTENGGAHGGDPRVLTLQPFGVRGRSKSTSACGAEIGCRESGHDLQHAGQLEDGEGVRVHDVRVRQNPDEQREESVLVRVGGAARNITVTASCSAPLERWR